MPAGDDKAINNHQHTPQTITLDGYAASHRAVREMKVDGELPADTKLRSSKYLNNLIEQDHRGVKLRIGPMLGFKQLRTAAVTIAGIELLRRIPGAVQPERATFQREKCACYLECGAGSAIKHTSSNL